MTDPLSLAATVLAQKPYDVAQAAPPAQPAHYAQAVKAEKNRLEHLLLQLRRQNVQPEAAARPEASTPAAPVDSPQSGSQLYSQRLAAIATGQLYTHLPRNSFRSVWLSAQEQPSYEQWRTLLAQEAKAVANKQDNRPVSIILGDSLSLWFPSDRLPQNQVWLNQAISGETTRHILNRLSDFARTQPRVIYVMAGVNDLKNGVADREILSNLRQILTRLQQNHPQSKLVVQSILPTRLFGLSRDRITQLNQQLAAIAQEKGVHYLDLYSKMAGEDGALQPELTTDGLHLNAKGYATWQSALQQAELRIARDR